MLTMLVYQLFLRLVLRNTKFFIHKIVFCYKFLRYVNISTVFDRQEVLFSFLFLDILN